MRLGAGLRKFNYYNNKTLKQSAAILSSEFQGCPLDLFGPEFSAPNELSPTNSYYRAEKNASHEFDE